MKTLREIVENTQHSIFYYVPKLPVHFKHIGRIKSIKKIGESYIAEDTFDRWESTNDNSHLGDTSKQISDLLSKKRPKLSPNDAAGMRGYTLDSHDLNKSLIAKHRDKKHPLDPRDVRTQKTMDKLVKNPIGHPIHLYSGIGFDPSKEIKADKNGIRRMHMPAFTSTTHDKSIADGFAREKEKQYKLNGRHILHIYLKSANDKGFHVGNIGSMVGNQHETILPRNSRLKITGHEIHNTPEGTAHIWHSEIDDGE